MFVLEGAVEVIPWTAKAPVLDNELIVLPVTVLLVPEDPIVIPEIGQAHEIPVTVLPLTKLPLPPLAPPNEELIPTIALVPPVTLLRVLPVIL